MKRDGEHSGAVEEGDIAAVLDGGAAEDAEQAVHEAVVAGPEEEQPEVQLREAVVAGPDTPEPQPGRGRIGAVGAGEPGRHDAASVYGVQRGHEGGGGSAQRRD